MADKLPEQPALDPAKVDAAKPKKQRKLKTKPAPEEKPKDAKAIALVTAAELLQKSSPSSASASLERLSMVVDAVDKQKPLKTMQEDLAPTLANLTSKTDILLGTLLAHNFDRLNLYTNVRWKLESSLLKDLDAGKLDPAVKMAFLATAREEADKITAMLQKFVNPLSDIEASLDRADRAYSDGEKQIKKEMEGTRNHGRDHISKLTYKARKVAEKLAAVGGKPS